MGIRALRERLERYRKADLTAVRPWKAVLWLTLPALAGNAVQNAFNVIIMYYVSRLGTAAIAAVAVAGVVTMLVFTAVVGLSVGTTALVARYHGAREEENCRRAMITTLVFSVAVAVTVGAAGIIFGKSILSLLGAAPDVLDLAYQYVAVFFAGALGFILLLMTNAILRGLGDAVTPTVLAGVAVTLDVILEPIFIFGPGPLPALGVRGAALGAVLSFLLAAVLSLAVLAKRHLPRDYFHRRSFSWRMAGQLVTIGVPASAQMLIRVFAQMVIVGFVALGGTAAVAAFGIGNQLAGLTFIPSFAFAMTAAILVGQNLGAGKPAGAERAAFTATAMAVGAGAVIIAGLLAFAGPVVRVFDTAPEVVTLGKLFIYICGPSLLFTPLGMTLSRAMAGAGVSWAPLGVTALVLLGVRIPMAYIFTKVCGWGTVGVFWAIAVPNVLEGLGMLAVFKTGVWARKRL